MTLKTGVIMLKSLQSQHRPKAGLPLKRAPQPKLEASVEITCISIFDQYFNFPHPLQPVYLQESKLTTVPQSSERLTIVFSLRE